MQQHTERLAGDFGVTMGDGNGALLMQREQHARVGVAQMIDQAVVQSAVTGTRCERNVFNTQRAYYFSNVIAAPAGSRPFGFDRFIRLHG